MNKYVKIEIVFQAKNGPKMNEYLRELVDTVANVIRALPGFSDIKGVPPMTFTIHDREEDIDATYNDRV